MQIKYVLTNFIPNDSRFHSRTVQFDSYLGCSQKRNESQMLADMRKIRKLQLHMRYALTRGGGGG